MDDLISRQAAIDALDVLCQEHRYKIPGKRETYSQYNEAWQDALDRAEGAIFNLPSAQPEYKMDEWCHDCKEYDQERHCCPRFNRVIREAVKEIQPMRKKGKWIDDGLYGDNFPHHAWLCSECGEGVIEIDIPWYNFCPNCGADMRGDADENQNH